MFASRTGRGWPYSQVITLFQRLRRAAHIECPEGELHPPRLHDLRHTSAVHRVLACYREGKDVQRLLPQLATYLGHVDIKSRSEEHTPELQSLMRISYAVFCLKKKTTPPTTTTNASKSLL